MKSLELARRNIIFKCNQVSRLSYNYQYDIVKTLYYYLSIADKQKERFLHNEGYRVEEGNRFKLFNFALRFDGAIFKEQYIEVNEDSTIILIISGKEEIVNLILKGLLHIKKIVISGNEFSLVNIKKDGGSYFKNVMLYKTLSPIITTTKNEMNKIISLDPYVSKYYINLANNLKKKYKLIYGEEFKGILYFDIEDVLRMKRKSFTIKEGMYQIGYLYDVWVETTPKMQKIIYYLGLGEKNSIGAGCMDILRVGGIYE